MRRTLSGGEVRAEVCGEQFDGAFDRRTGHGDQVAESFAFVESEDLAELIENRLAPLSGLDFLDHHRQRIRFHAAGRALAARFSGKEIGDLHQLFDDAALLGNQFHDAAPERGAGIAHGIVIQRGVDLVQWQKRR